MPLTSTSWSDIVVVMYDLQELLKVVVRLHILSGNLPEMRFDKMALSKYPSYPPMLKTKTP